jgi:nucleoside-triphosphatase
MPDSNRSARVLLLSGQPGVGKTTVVRALPALLGGWRLAGFTTEEIRQGERRMGFQGRTIEGRVLLIAHRELIGPARVGAYGVDIAAIDELAKSLQPRNGVDAYVIDEIGKMECMSKAFVAAVQHLLTLPVRLVATVSAQGGGVIAAVKSHPRAQLWDVTIGSRASLPGEIVAWLQTPRA